MKSNSKNNTADMDIFAFNDVVRNYICNKRRKSTEKSMDSSAFYRNLDVKQMFTGISGTIG